MSARQPPRVDLARARGQWSHATERTPDEPPLRPYEWMIAWRYLRAKRAEGGVSVMTWISLVGVTLAVFALIATLAVRSGFREEFVDTILGANAHVTVYKQPEIDANGRQVATIADASAMADLIAQVPGVTRAAPLVRGQVMATFQGRNSGVEVFGIAPEDLATIPRVAHPEEAEGSLDDFPQGIAIGSGVARELGIMVGDKLRIISPDGARTPMGVSPRVSAYTVTYIFTSRALRHRPHPRIPAAPRGAEVLQPRRRRGRDRGHAGRPRRRGGDRPRDPSGRRSHDARLDLEGLLRCVPECADRRGQRDVRDPLGPRADRLDEHHLGSHHAGEEQGPRHRHPPHDGPDRGRGAARLLPLRGKYRHHRHDPRRPPRLRLRHLDRPDLRRRELPFGRGRLGPLDPGHLSPARQARMGRRALGGVPVPVPVLGRHALPRAPRRPHEPRRGPAL
ncbi:Lipoprotein releasing system transmembrane protein LolC [Rubellimicrobium mesophilum DSM 19309]|uniref:Lipoprotein releasing system transmembrane protein LolC n=1 Tax=Rubellimicrobium mesophilum DSM 19309 TaxID=442562 RepID=A0A017HX21_9RHOB|nr:Lipoprotein releasing system transmembrane protein LolC [Rubellimicrobium mesophilum DSM 19309]